MSTVAEKQKRIAQEVLAVLASIEWSDGVAKLTGELDRKLYVKTDKVLKALGGKWNRRIRGHVFDCDGETAVADAVEFGCYVDQKQAYQFFETPSWLANELCESAKIKPGFVVLEPSVGRAAIANEAFKFGGQVWCVELDGKSIAAICELDSVHKIVEGDFLQQTPEDLGLFDAVVMNPPFAKRQDIAHVRHAFEFLKPGAILAAVMSSSFCFRSDSKSTAFRNWATEIGAHVKQNSEGSFRDSGTMVSTVKFIAQKAAETN